MSGAVGQSALRLPLDRRDRPEFTVTGVVMIKSPDLVLESLYRTVRGFSFSDAKIGDGKHVLAVTIAKQ